MAQRVRTGCKTCRKRRVKCDETKPSCKRCINANFQCEGFVDPKSVSMVSTRSVSTSDSSSSRSQSPSPELSWRHQGWQREQLPLYHHFITTTATTLFRSDHVNFWRDQVAQMSFGVDIVYEALLAVGAIHRAALISCQSGNSHEAAKFRVLGFYSYGRVLKLIPELLTRDDPSDMLALLIALMLLTYFECFVESARGALRHLWAAIQLLNKAQGTASDLAPIYDVILRLDFLAQKLVPYAGSSFLRCSEISLMESPFWNRPALIFSGGNHLDQIAAERYRLMQLVGSHNVLSRVLWGCWCPIDERPSREELMGFYDEIKLWKINSPATFSSSFSNPDIRAVNFSAMASLPIPPPALHFASTEAAITIAMHNAYLGCALAMIGTTGEDDTSHELEAFNLMYENMCIANGLVGAGNQNTAGYKSCDTLGVGISLFLFIGGRRAFSSSWQSWTLNILRSIGREGLFNGATSGNALQIMWELEARVRSTEGPDITRQKSSPLGMIKERMNPLLMPAGDDGQQLAYFLRYGDAGDESTVRIAAKARWKEDENGTAHSLQLDIYDESAGSVNPGSKPPTLEMFSSWRDSVESGWHGYLTA